MNFEKFASMRAIGREIFARTLAEIAIPKVLSQRLEGSGRVLRICDDLFDLKNYSRIFAVSMGKAAYPMIEALAAVTGPVLSGIVVSGHPPAAWIPGLQYYEGGHPLPSPGSLRAAEGILNGLNSLDDRALVLFLISGGASAMVEKPLESEISLEDLITTHRTLVHSGAPIRDMNAVRKHLSAVKGGRLAQAAHPAQQVSILVSDVPDGSLDALASGPTMPDSSTADECYEIARRYAIVKQFPESVRRLFEQRGLPETPKSDDPAFALSRWWTILSSATAARTAASLAGQQGFAVEIDNSCDEWEYGRAADHLLHRLRGLRKGISRACIISAGEVSVKIEASAGRGGRNQQFALYCAQEIDGQNIAVLSAGTDGIDGASHAAGAIADGSTLDRSRKAGIDVAAALRNFDSTPVFEALQDLVVTGPTGNNVRDLRVLMTW